ncbi:hypothetical protein BCR34DRAFT_669461 [Clohesyomyces aquaticus]|uniref:Uncharacterized protein n=1 Tax=Clohesyomyces aquaticus TaxID=1231657 RepID=A0A1Y1YBI7_9PLEO|nr:hypothetical protein BCR34DRAFT_669461 [Clohesyomyces aquaticus]
MRFVCLDSNIDEPLLSHARTRMREEEFLSSVRAFLSLLAIAETEYLDYVQLKLLPHKLSFHRCPPATTTRDAFQYTPDGPPSRSHTGDDAQLSNAISGSQLRTTASTPRLTTPETTDSRDLFATYTTLEDHPSPYEQAASVDEEMLDRSEDITGALTASCSMSHSLTLPTSGNTCDTLPTTTDSNKPATDIMSDVAETSPLPWSSQAERHTECSTASPSQTSSSWSLSPVVDSMYAWSASLVPPTHYLRSVKQLDRLYGGSSARGLRNLGEIIEIGDSFLREDAGSFIQSIRHRWGREGLWYRSPLSNPNIGDSVAERMLESLRCAKTVEHDSAVDPVRLKMARIFLYQYFEQKRLDVQKDPRLLSMISQGKNRSSIVLDVILEHMYSCNKIQVGLQV